MIQGLQWSVNTISCSDDGNTFLLVFTTKPYIGGLKMVEDGIHDILYDPKGVDKLNNLFVRF